MRILLSLTYLLHFFSSLLVMSEHNKDWPNQNAKRRDSKQASATNMIMVSSINCNQEETAKRASLAIEPGSVSKPPTCPCNISTGGRGFAVYKKNRHMNYTKGLPKPPKVGKKMALHP